MSNPRAADDFGFISKRLKEIAGEIVRPEETCPHGNQHFCAEPPCSPDGSLKDLKSPPAQEIVSSRGEYCDYCGFRWGLPPSTVVPWKEILEYREWSVIHLFTN